MDESSGRFQLIVIGTGSAATTVALQVREAGGGVAVIDDRPFGGTCALRGCDPKKVLIGAASATDHAQRMAGKGVAGKSHVEWPELVAFKRSFTDPVPAAKERLYADKGIACFHGQARFTGRNTLDVGGAALEAEHILIASGAEPMQLGIRGEEHLVTSEDFMALESLPPHIVLVGGGYIAAELSSLASCAGSQVTVLERGERMLTPFDPDLVDWLMESFAARGIDVRTRTAVEGIEQTSAGFRVHATHAGQNLAFDADLVVHAAGRTPALGALDLAAAGVSSGDGRLQLNEYLQSVSNPAVYAAGDAAQCGPPLTPVASLDGELVAANLLQGNHRKAVYAGIPSVVFSIPPLATVGLGEAQARDQGLQVRVNCQKASDWFTARQAAQPTYGFKVLIDAQTDRVLGAHLVGPHADEVINVFTLAIRQAMTAADLNSTLFAYPTGASDISHML